MNTKANRLWLKHISLAYLTIVYHSSIFLLPNDLYICMHALLHLILGIAAVTSKLMDRYPKLVTTENEEGLTPLQMLLARCCEFS